MSKKDQSDRLSHIFAAISIAGMLTLSFVLGAYVTEFETFPYPQLLERPFRALEASAEKLSWEFNPKASNRWTKAKPGKKGIMRYDEEKACNGYTVWASVGADAWLMDMEGNMVHEWNKPFYEIWSEGTPHIRDPVEEKAIALSGAHLFPNGNVLVNYTAVGDTPYGYGLAMLDKDSNVIWKFSENVHHDFFVAEDNTIWTLIHRFRDLSEQPVEGMTKKFNGKTILEDVIVRLSPDGEELEQINLTEAVYNSTLGSKVGSWHQGESWDLLHTNNVETIPSDFAGYHEFAEPGQLLVSFREISVIALVGRESGKVEWYRRGFWLKQHDPDPLPNGNIMIFDNLGHSGPGGKSRVAEFDPVTGERVWTYAGTIEDPFFTKWGGKQVPLPNGNILITENLGARIFEVNRDKEIVWEVYNHKLRTSVDGIEYVGTISGRAQRVKPEELEFLN